MLLELAVLASLGLGGYYVTSYRTRDYSKKETSMMDDYHMHRKDLREAGISWGTQKTQDLNLNNLNEAYKPRSAPTQIPTHDLDEILTDQADITAYVNQHAYPFYFRRVSEVPLATAAQATLSIEIPIYGRSFKGDKKNSLASYPRVYSDKWYPGDNKSYSTFTGFKGTMGAEEPESYEEVYVPREGDMNRDYNPWGPGGVIQRIYNKDAERVTRRKRTDRAAIGRPSKLSRRRFVYEMYP